MLKVENLRFSYGGGRNIVDGISFELNPHDILCLLGPNGTGKTTLLRCILGLNKATSGSVTVNDRNLNSMRGRERAKAVAFVPQAANMAFQYEGAEVVMMGRVSGLSLGRKPKASDREVVDDVFRRLEIEHLRHKLFNNMSGGERQMILVARALAQQAGVIIMDEPTASLDYSNQVKILQVVNDLASAGYSILMTSHFPDHAFLACSRAALLKGGHIVKIGTPEDIVTSENLSDLYETPVCVADAYLAPVEHTARVCVPVIMNDRKIYSNVCPCEAGESLRMAENGGI